jgi:thioredoxin-like negative regulator of GroEL
MKPLVEGLEKTYSSKIEFRRLNVQSDQSAISLADSLGVQYVPTFIFVNADGAIAKTTVGGMTQADMVTAITALK